MFRKRTTATAQPIHKRGWPISKRTWDMADAKLPYLPNAEQPSMVIDAMLMSPPRAKGMENARYH